MPFRFVKTVSDNWAQIHDHTQGKPELLDPLRKQQQTLLRDQIKCR